MHAEKKLMAQTVITIRRASMSASVASGMLLGDEVQCCTIRKSQYLSCFKWTQKDMKSFLSEPDNRSRVKRDSTLYR